MSRESRIASMLVVARFPGSSYADNLKSMMQAEAWKRLEAESEKELRKFKVDVARMAQECGRELSRRYPSAKITVGSGMNGAWNTVGNAQVWTTGKVSDLQFDERYKVMVLGNWEGTPLSVSVYFPMDGDSSGVRLGNPRYSVYAGRREKAYGAMPSGKEMADQVVETFEADKGMMELLNPESFAENTLSLEQVLKFCEKQRTWFGFEIDGEIVLGSTREHGSIGNESPGEADIREGKRLVYRIQQEFGNKVSVQFDTVDEWTNVTVTIPRRFRVSRGVRAWNSRPSQFTQEVKRLRVDLMGAWREMQRLLREAKGGELEGMTQQALSSIVEAVQAVDKLIGAGVSVDVDQQVGFLAHDRKAVARWTSVTHMRKDIDEMAAQCKGWVTGEQEAANTGRSGFNYSQYYGAVLDALDACSDRLRRVEHLV